MTLPDLLKSTRQFFWRRHFTEVEIDYLNPSLPLEPNLYSFSTTWQHSQDKFYLPTSPEMALKRHLFTHPENCFAISHCFRDLESSGTYHTPEFLMLEWYLPGQDLSKLMTFTQDYLSQFLSFPTPYPIFTLPPNLPNTEVEFNQYFLNHIEPSLPNGPVFVTGYPAFLSPLAESITVDKSFSTNDSEAVFSAHSERAVRKQADKPEGSAHCKKTAPNQKTALRFELYINRIEIANGCTENTNLDQINHAFEQEQLYRQNHRLPTHPINPDFARYCASLPQPTSGCGFGLSRLLQLAKSKLK